MSSQDSPERALLIAAEKVRIQYRNMPTAFVGSAVICSLMGFALLTGAGLEKTIAWMAVVYLWVIARFIQWRAFNRINPAPRDMQPWRWMGIGGSALAGSFGVWVPSFSTYLTVWPISCFW